MNGKNLHLLIPLFLFVLVDYSSANAKSSDSLESISGTAILIKEISSTAAKDGLTEDKLYNFLENKLDKANIRLLTTHQWTQVYGGSYLYLKVIASKSESKDIYAVFLDLECIRSVVLIGRKLGDNKIIPAAIWSVSKFLPCNTSELEKCVLKGLDDISDIFIKEYRSANPL